MKYSSWTGLQASGALKDLLFPEENRGMPLCVVTGTGEDGRCRTFTVEEGEMLEGGHPLFPNRVFFSRNALASAAESLGMNREETAGVLTEAEGRWRRCIVLHVEDELPGDACVWPVRRVAEEGWQAPGGAVYRAASACLYPAQFFKIERRDRPGGKWEYEPGFLMSSSFEQAQKNLESVAVPNGWKKVPVSD